MDPLPDVIAALEAGRITADAACAILDASAARHYGDMSRDAGVVYTPMPVARSICRRAIGSCLAQGQPLEDIRIFDSSCGSGIFLQAALEELYRLRLDRMGGQSEYALKKDIVERCLFGMDVDRYSVDIASLRLRLLLAAPSGREPVRVNVTCDNALFARDIGPFDVIVGNPPYMRVKSMSSDQKVKLPWLVKASGLYQYQEGNLNLYKLFIERNLYFLKPGGSMGLIIPSSFLNEATSVKLRKHVFDACRLEEIIEIPERSRLFPGVNQATAIIVLNKSQALQGVFRLRLGADTGSLDDGDGAISVGYEELAAYTEGRMEVPLLRNPELEWAMMRRLKDIPAFRGRNGIPPVGDISVGNVDETFDREHISREPTGHIFVKGIHLKEYAVDLTPEGRQPRWVKQEEFLQKKPTAARTIARWRIIGRNTQNKACARRLKFALLPPGYLCSNSIKQLAITDGAIAPLYLLGLLNSSTLNWYFELFCSQNNIRVYNIAALPIVRATGEVQSAFARVARAIMDSSGETGKFLDKQLMDSMVYELYLGGPGLIDAVIALPDKGEPIVDTGIRRMIEEIGKEEAFEVIRKAAYRL